jgi:hypothetical protein
MAKALRRSLRKEDVQDLNRAGALPEMRREVPSRNQKETTTAQNSKEASPRSKASRRKINNSRKRGRKVEATRNLEALASEEVVEIIDEAEEVANHHPEEQQKRTTGDNS